MALPKAALIALWQRALASPIGIRIATLEPRLLQTDLYKARQEQLDASLYDLTIQMPPNLDEVWILKKDTTLPSELEEASTTLAPE